MVALSVQQDIGGTVKVTFLYSAFNSSTFSLKRELAETLHQPQSVEYLDNHLKPNEFYQKFHLKHILEKNKLNRHH